MKEAEVLENEREECFINKEKGNIWKLKSNPKYTNHSLFTICVFIGYA